MTSSTRDTNENPYTSPAESKLESLPPSENKPPVRIWRCLVSTALVAVIASFPLAGLIGLVFRFPVPFAGYMSGPSAIVPAMFGVFLYGIIGGAVVQAVVGCVGGMFVYRAAQRKTSKLVWLVMAAGVLSALPGLLLLAMLDWIIGPW